MKSINREITMSYMIGVKAICILNSKKHILKKKNAANS